MKQNKKHEAKLNSSLHCMWFIKYNQRYTVWKLQYETARSCGDSITRIDIDNEWVHALLGVSVDWDESGLAGL